MCAIYDDEDKASQPNGCRREEAFCNLPPDHVIHSPLYWGKPHSQYPGRIGHRYVAPVDNS